MPTVTINKKVFENLVGKKLPLEKLKDRVSYLGTDLEKIDDKEIVVEIFPNRPDMLSEQGLARAFGSFIGLKKGLRDYKVIDSKEKVIIDRSVARIRPYTACAIVKGIAYDNEKIKEIIQIQEKLHVTYGRNRRKAAIGIYPYEKIKPPIRFLAKKPEDIIFKPLEFQREINGRQILSQHPAGREYGYLLDGLEKYPLFIDADNQILSMPPIINSHKTGKITEKTKDVFIECSGFDFNVLQKCLNIIVTALADMGGKIYSMKLHYPDKVFTTPNLKPDEMAVDISYINKRLGLNLKEREIKDCLERMGYGYKDKKALIPSYRADILHQIDLAEDIAIAYGYENFEESIPNAATTGNEDNFEVFKNKISEILIGLGLIEASTYNLTSKNFQTKLMSTEIPLIELANAKSADYNVLRAWLIPSLMEILKNNKHHDYPQKIFGIGTVFKKNEKFETNIEENERLAVLLCEDSTDFTEIKQVLDYLFGCLGISYDIEDAEHSSFIPGRVARVIAKNKKIAYIGEIHPSVLENWGLEFPVSALEINLTELSELI